jgi:hypothetical protein
MSETITGTDTLAKSRTARRASPSSAEFQFPQFEVLKMEVPDAVRNAATKWIDQGKKAFEEMNDAFESTYSTFIKGAVDCGAKVTKATRNNTTVALDVAHELMAAKSLPEVIEISTTGARKQFEFIAAHNQELWSFTQQLVTETIKPIAGSLPKVFSPGVSSS